MNSQVNSLSSINHHLNKKIQMASAHEHKMLEIVGMLLGDKGIFLNEHKLIKSSSSSSSTPAGSNLNDKNPNPNLDKKNPNLDTKFTDAHIQSYRQAQEEKNMKWEKEQMNANGLNQLWILYQKNLRFPDLGKAWNSVAGERTIRTMLIIRWIFSEFQDARKQLAFNNSELFSASNASNKSATSHNSASNNSASNKSASSASNKSHSAKNTASGNLNNAGLSTTTEEKSANKKQRHDISQREAGMDILKAVYGEDVSIEQMENLRLQFNKAMASIRPGDILVGILDTKITQISTQRDFFFSTSSKDFSNINTNIFAEKDSLFPEGSITDSRPDHYNEKMNILFDHMDTLFGNSSLESFYSRFLNYIKNLAEVLAFGTTTSSDSAGGINSAGGTVMPLQKWESTLLKRCGNLKNTAKKVAREFEGADEESVQKGLLRLADIVEKENPTLAAEIQKEQQNKESKRASRRASRASTNASSRASAASSRTSSVSSRASNVSSSNKTESTDEERKQSSKKKWKKLSKAVRGVFKWSKGQLQEVTNVVRTPTRRSKTPNKGASKESDFSGLNE